jgi:hexosaminidase
MSWRGTRGGIAAAQQGHYVVMTPNTPLYFDHYQGDPRREPFAIGGMSPIEAVYAYEPVPPELTNDESRYILGAQANVWTEYIKTPWHVEYMVFPRLLALSESVWSPPAQRDWDGFLPRLLAHQQRLDALGVVYRPYRPAPVE